MLARWILLAGLIALLGAAMGSIARFGGGARNARRVGASGWLLAAAGLVLLTDAQRRNANTSLHELFQTPVGRALIWRGVSDPAPPGLRCCSLAGFAGWQCRSGGRRHAGGDGDPRRRRARRVRRLAANGVDCAAMGPLCRGGHLARRARRPATGAAQRAFGGQGGRRPPLLPVRGWRSQSFSARPGSRAPPRSSRRGATSSSTTATARRCSRRSSSCSRSPESRGQPSTRRARCRSPNLSLLRRLSRIELGLAAGALGLAAVLGSLAPPASSGTVAPLGLTLSGADAHSIVQVRLAVASAQPGPNRFVLHAVDFGSKTPVQAGHASLRFTPLDDPGVAPTSLRARPRPRLPLRRVGRQRRVRRPLACDRCYRPGGRRRPGAARARRAGAGAVHLGRADPRAGTQVHGPGRGRGIHPRLAASGARRPEQALRDLLRRLRRCVDGQVSRPHRRSGEMRQHASSRS